MYFHYLGNGYIAYFQIYVFVNLVMFTCYYYYNDFILFYSRKKSTTRNVIFSNIGDVTDCWNYDASTLVSISDCSNIIKIGENHNLIKLSLLEMKCQECDDMELVSSRSWETFTFTQPCIVAEEEWWLELENVNLLFRSWQSVITKCGLQPPIVTENSMNDSCSIKWIYFQEVLDRTAK